MNALLEYANNVFSQNGEDGIIDELFRRIGIKNGTCCEFGAWDGIYFSNTRNLILKGWRGIMIEGDRGRFKQLATTYENNSNITCINRFVDVNCNSVDIICAEHDVKSLDFLSIDIDGLDCEILESLTILPRVVCIEVSGGFAPEYQIRNSPDIAQHNLGQSISVISHVAHRMGYGLVCYTGNAFFVTRDDIKAGSLTELSPEEAYKSWHARLPVREKEWLYLANLGAVNPYFHFANPYLDRRSLGISLGRSVILRYSITGGRLRGLARKTVKFLAGHGVAKGQC